MIWIFLLYSLNFSQAYIIWGSKNLICLSHVEFGVGQLRIVVGYNSVGSIKSERTAYLPLRNLVQKGPRYLEAFMINNMFKTNYTPPKE